MADKNCIFHIPFPFSEKATSGSKLRPLKMVDALRNIGYKVDVISGYGKERAKAIKIVKTKIENGIFYSFLYSESSTMPTLLTEKNHMPLHPRLDFSFFEYCKKRNIPIGLFYRDIHWKFSLYDNNISKYKSIVAKHFYKYDLKKYKECLTCLFLPSLNMEKYLRELSSSISVYDLPPGTEIKNNANISEKKEKINLFYVGGVGEIYQFPKLLQAAKDLDFVNLVVCCREEEWNENIDLYRAHLNENVKIIHASGKDLEKQYERADICMCFLKNNLYLEFAMPVKIFEYLSNCKPIVASDGTEGGAFVERNNIGWSIKYDTGELKKLLTEIYRKQKLLVNMQDDLLRVREKNTWERRAKKVEAVLTGGYDEN